VPSSKSAIVSVPQREGKFTAKRPQGFIDEIVAARVAA
jgi:hypothetical protein